MRYKSKRAARGIRSSRRNRQISVRMSGVQLVDAKAVNRDRVRTAVGECDDKVKCDRRLLAVVAIRRARTESA